MPLLPKVINSPLLPEFQRLPVQPGQSSSLLAYLLAQRGRASYIPTPSPLLSLEDSSQVERCIFPDLFSAFHLHCKKRFGIRKLLDYTKNLKALITNSRNLKNKEMFFKVTRSQPTECSHASKKLSFLASSITF